MEGPFELFVGDLMTANEAAAALPFSIMHTVFFNTAKELQQLQQQLAYFIKIKQIYVLYVLACTQQMFADVRQRV